MRQFLSILSVLLLACSAFAAGRLHPSAFELRSVSEAASPDTVPTSFSSGEQTETLHLSRDPLLDVTAVKSAGVSTDPLSGSPIVQIVFNTEGTKKFSDITAQHVGKRIAILVDGKVLIAPIVRAPISGGRAHIAGNLTKEEAEKIAKRINDAIVSQSKDSSPAR
jgi:preprotein translocase subunit SecD